MRSDPIVHVWWIERDDGEVVSPLYLKEATAERVHQKVYDTSEYRIAGGSVTLHREPPE